MATDPFGTKHRHSAPRESELTGRTRQETRNSSYWAGLDRRRQVWLIAISTCSLGLAAASSTALSVAATAQSDTTTSGVSSASSLPSGEISTSGTLAVTTQASSATGGGSGSEVASSVAAASGPPIPTSSTSSTVVLPTPNTGAIDGTNRWTVLFGGDTLLTRSVPATANPFGKIQPALSSGNIAIVNLETAISTRGTRQVGKEFTFRSAPSFASRIATAGIDVVSLANNHTLDFGTAALLDTRAYLNSAGVRNVGAGSSRTEALTPIEITVKGARVAILAASQIIPPGAWVATESRPGIASAGKHVIDDNTRQLLRAVTNAKLSNDIVLVVMHWGIEGSPCPSPVQTTLAKQLRAAGATAVLGAHPHVLQPIVADATGLTAYSLGNFIWDPRGGATADTGVLELRFDGTAFAGHAFYPHRLDANGWAAAVDPNSASGKRIAGRTTARCGGK
jgi:Bacterial capsule synthesis protein PGA_cap